MTTAIATRSAQSLQIAGNAIQIAEMMGRSQIVPPAYRGKPADIAAAIMLGAEVGLPPIQALRSIAVINGRPSLWGDAALAVVMAHPDFEDIKETLSGDGKLATCTIKRKGREPCTRTFSIEEARRAKLLGKKGPWQEYQNRMMQMRARGFCMRDCFPDALSGIVLREEAVDMPPLEGAVTIDPDDTAGMAGQAAEAVFEDNPHADFVDALTAAKLDRDINAVRELAKSAPTLELRQSAIEAGTALKAEVEKQNAQNAHNYGPPAMTDEEVAEAEEAMRQ